MKFTDWQTELEKCGYVVTEDLVTTKRGDVLAGKDSYGGYYVNDSQIQDIVSRKPAVKEQVKKTVKAVAKKATKLVMERARDKNGNFIADDPTTEVNEAWVVKNKED